MQKEIHPQYNTEAKVECACGHKFTVGSTKKDIHVEVCSNCHPFFTGLEKVMDTAGRVEKFKTRQSKAGETKVAKPKKATVKTKK